MSKAKQTNEIGVDDMTPQQRANRKQNEIRKGMPRLPSAYLSDEENELVCLLGDIAGTKRAAIFEGLALLKKQYIRQGKLKAEDKK